MIEVIRAGMVTAIGNDCLSSCAAIRAGISAFQQVPLVLADGPVTAAPARHLTGNALGISLLGALASEAVRDAEAEQLVRSVPVIFALPERGRLGIAGGQASRIVAACESHLRTNIDRPTMHVIEEGPVSSFMALARARDLLVSGSAEYCVLIAVDSLLDSDTIGELFRAGRLKSVSNPDGLIPGEAAVCLVIRRRAPGSRGLWVRGLGFGTEPSPIGSERPVLGDGLGLAMKKALQDAGCTMEEVDFRISDVTGERYGFADANYALARVLRIRKPKFDFLHLMDTLGAIGAAAGACELAYLRFAYEKGCVPQSAAFCETSSDDGRRAVAVVSR